MTPSDSLRAALRLLCERAGVDPDDRAAGARVRAWYCRGWRGDEVDESCPAAGPLTAWLRAHADLGGCGLLVSAERAYLTRRADGATRLEAVPLPPAVRAAAGPVKTDPAGLAPYTPPTGEPSDDTPVAMHDAKRLTGCGHGTFQRWLSEGLAPAGQRVAANGRAMDVYRWGDLKAFAGKPRRGKRRGAQQNRRKRGAA